MLQLSLSADFKWKKGVFPASPVSAKKLSCSKCRRDILKSCFAKVCGGVVAGRVRLNLGGNRSTMSSASRHDSSRRCDENVLVTTGISGSSEMIVDAQETKGDKRCRLLWAAQCGIC